MRHIIVLPTSPRRWIAWFHGTDLIAKGTSEQFAVGQLMKNHGHKIGTNVAPAYEMWVWTEKLFDKCRVAQPIKEANEGLLQQEAE